MFCGLCLCLCFGHIKLLSYLRCHLDCGLVRLNKPCIRWDLYSYTGCSLYLGSPELPAIYVLNTHTHLTALFPGLPRWASTRKAKPFWILLKQETVSGSGISWAICKSAPCSRQITMPALHHSVFYRPDAFPAAHPTASKHWRLIYMLNILSIIHTGLQQSGLRRPMLYCLVLAVLVWMCCRKCHTDVYIRCGVA